MTSEQPAKIPGPKFFVFLYQLFLANGHRNSDGIQIHTFLYIFLQMQ